MGKGAQSMPACCERLEAVLAARAMNPLAGLAADSDADGRALRPRMFPACCEQSGPVFASEELLAGLAKDSDNDVRCALAKAYQPAASA